MSTAFSRTLRSLERDGFRRYFWGFSIAILLLGAWLAWFCLSRVGRYEVSDTARLEVNQAMYLVQAPVTGRVVACNLVLGRMVRAGDILVDLDSKPERLQLAEERTRLQAAAPQIGALREEAAATAQSRGREQQSTQVAQEEARARSREAEALSQHAESEAERLQKLHSGGLVAERDLAQAKADAQVRRAAGESLGLVAGRLEREQLTRESDRDAQLNRLNGQIRQFEGQQTTSAAVIQKLQYEIERRRIRAPVDGRLGEVTVVRIGGVVQEGQKLGAIVPGGTIRAIAEFLPPAALGRVHPGQPARLRLEGFPWAQYGSVAATVSTVGSEVRDGHVRVELEVNARPGSSIPLQHGLPGSVEIEVERVSPATLALRAAGRLIAQPRSSFGSQTQ